MFGSSDGSRTLYESADDEEVRLNLEDGVQRAALERGFFFAVDDLGAKVPAILAAFFELLVHVHLLGPNPGAGTLRAHLVVVR